MIKMFSKEFWVMAMGFGIPMWIVMTLFSGAMEEFSLKLLGVNFIAYVVIVGPLFATVLVLFAIYAFKKVTITIPGDEALIKEYGANLFRGKEGVGGKVALTDKSVIFKSHKVNIQTGETIINIEDISGYEVKDRLFNLLKNDVILKTTDKDYRFIIQRRDEFITELKKLILNI